VATQVMLRGFDDRLSARELVDRLEAEAGTVWRCRLKTSVTPPGSYPDFQLQLPLVPDATAASRAAASPDDGVVPAHAFVYFARPGAAGRAARSGLQLYGGRSGRMRTPSDVISSSLRAARRRRHCDAKPMLFPDSRVEAGHLVALGSRHLPRRLARGGRPRRRLRARLRGGPVRRPLPAAVRPRRRVRLPRRRGAADAVLRRQAGVPRRRRRARALAFMDDDSLLLQLSAAPLLYYRTAGYDVHGPVPFDLIDDDDDPWIRTTDVTSPPAAPLAGAARTGCRSGRGSGRR